VWGAAGHAAREGEFMRLLRLVPFVSSMAVLCSMLCAGAAFAQEDDEEEADFGRTGFYVGVGGALTHLMDAEGRFEDEFADAVSPDLPVDADTKTGFGVNGRGGYRFHSHFAAELEIDWHAPFEADYEIGGSEVGEAQLEPLVFTGNLKGYLFKDRFQPYAVLGLGLMTAKLEIRDADDFLWQDDRLTDFAARLGGGADMYVTEHIVFNAEIRYVLPTGAVKDFDMISFGWGIQYRF
jgi:opacity protein-like surface antigen